MILAVYWDVKDQIKQNIFFKMIFSCVVAYICLSGLLFINSYIQNTNNN